MSLSNKRCCSRAQHLRSAPFVNHKTHCGHQSERSRLAAQMVQQLEKARFRSIDLLDAPRNEMHASKVYYVASMCLAHAKLIFTSLATIVLAPGYLVKNQPNLALYLGLPTLKKIGEKMQSYFFQTEDNLLLEG